MMTITNALTNVVATITGLIQLIDRELNAMEMLGNTEAKNTFMKAKVALQVSPGVTGFAGGVRMLNAINTCAKLFEEQVGHDPVVSTYWLQHAYEFRVNAELAATDLLHAAGNVPQFECSLARLRISCAHLAKQLGYRDATLGYAQGALRLAAPESDVELAKLVMQTH